MTNRSPQNFNTSSRSIPLSLIDAAGDLVVGAGNNRVARLPAGTSGSTTLVSNSSAATGMSWITPYRLPLEIVTLTASFTIDASHAGVMLIVDSASTVTITLPNTTAIPTGSQMLVFRKNTGIVQFQTSGGATIINPINAATPKVRATYSVASIHKIGTSQYLVSGDISA